MVDVYFCIITDLVHYFAGKNLHGGFSLTNVPTMTTKGVFWQNWNSNVEDNLPPRWREWYAFLWYVICRKFAVPLCVFLLFLVFVSDYWFNSGKRKPSKFWDLSFHQSTCRSRNWFERQCFNHWILANLQIIWSQSPWRNGNNPTSFLILHKKTSSLTDKKHLNECLIFLGSYPIFQVKCVEVFKEFYQTKTKYRKLTWIYSLGTCHLIGKFDPKPIEIIVTTYQVSYVHYIIILFIFFWVKEIDIFFRLQLCFYSIHQINWVILKSWHN